MRDPTTFSSLIKDRRQRPRSPAAPLLDAEFNDLTAAYGTLQRSGKFDVSDAPLPRLRRAIVAGIAQARGALTFDGTSTIIRDLRRCIGELRAAGKEKDAACVANFARVVERW